MTPSGSRELPFYKFGESHPSKLQLLKQDPTPNPRKKMNFFEFDIFRFNKNFFYFILTFNSDFTF